MHLPPVAEGQGLSIFSVTFRRKSFVEGVKTQVSLNQIKVFPAGCADHRIDPSRAIEVKTE